jgi:hypothetical protein
MKTLITLLLSMAFSLPAYAWHCRSPNPVYPSNIHPEAQKFLNYFNKAKEDGSFYLGNCEIKIQLTPLCDDIGSDRVAAVELDARVTDRTREYNYYSRAFLAEVNLASGRVEPHGSEGFRYSFSKKDGLEILDLGYVYVSRHYFGANRDKYRFQFKTNAEGRLQEAFWRQGDFIPFIYDQSVSCK